VLDRWWDGFGGERGSLERAFLLQRLSFQHFSDSSFLLEREDGELVAFLVGFMSQARSDESYIHFVGVDPAERGRGLGRHLYRLFFDHSRRHGRQGADSSPKWFSAGAPSPLPSEPKTWS
jgi:ribosomal protein S18 acetylase RimI-like enzyme